MTPIIKRQKGFLTIVLVVMMVIAAVMSGAASHLFTTEQHQVTTKAEGTQAFFVAEAGLQTAGYYLLADTASSRRSCSGLTGYSPLTNTVVGLGTFTAQQDGSTYYIPTATLTSNISASATTIPVNSTTNYASAGRIMIGREAINYTGKTSSSFTGARRGVAETQASTHFSGMRVTQYQCDVESAGHIPNAGGSRAKRTLKSSFQLQEGWIVGQDNSNTERFGRWNRPSELTWNDESQSLSSSKDLRGISMLGNGEGWAVGDDRSGDFFIMRYNPDTENWDISPNLPQYISDDDDDGDSDYIRDLNAVHAVSHHEAWAVGDRSDHSGNSRRFTVVRWDGSQWCLLQTSGTSCTSLTITSDRGYHLYGIQVIDTNGDGLGDFGFAVGQSGYVLQYNGSTWTRSKPASEHLYAVSVVSTTEAWATGRKKTLERWNGSSWTAVSLSGSNQDLRAIDMIDTDGDGDADYGFIVGKSSRVYYYNGSSWSTLSLGSLGDLYAVKAFGPRDVWMAGTNNYIYHYNGSGITSYAAPWTQTIYGMDLIGPKDKSRSQSNWQEVFH